VEAQSYTLSYLERKVKVLMVIVVVRKHLILGNTFGNGSEEDITTH
jgi:hypothetical protein